MNARHPLRASQRGATTNLVETLQNHARRVEAKGQRVIYLHVGQPSTGAPSGVVEAVRHAATESTLGYTGAAGIDPLRQRIAREYRNRYGVDIEPERVIVTLGASGALILALIGCFEEGAQIGIPDPFYFGYRHIMPTLGLRCVSLNTSMEQHFQPTVEDLQDLDQDIAGLIVASPCNPTGSMMTPGHLKEVAEYCEANDIRLISDEIYHGIVFDEDCREATAVAFSEEAIVVGSFSKFYSMAGWRVGWMVVPTYMTDSLSKLAGNLYICPPAPSQIGALAALDCTAELAAHVERYRRNRDLLVRAMPEIGFDRFSAPHGAFYLYCHVQHLHHDSVLFCDEMLEGCGVLAYPGTDFNTQHGHHYVRFSYAGSTADIEEAIARIRDWRRNPGV